MRTLGHPLVLSAAAVVALNDFVLRGHAPGWLTGKLSDVGWLVVTPVVFAALLATFRVRYARPWGLLLAVGIYVSLQLWPPLGDALAPGHVADLGDLWALPAVAGAILAWRWECRAAPAILAWPLLAAVLVADSDYTIEAGSWPCGEGGEWPADEPLRIDLTDAPVDTDDFLRGLRLTTGGADVPVVAAQAGGWVKVCAREGLRDGRAYTWEIGPWDDASGNSLPYRHAALPTVEFVAVGDGTPVDSAAECARRGGGATPTACGGALSDTGADTGEP